MSRDIVLHHRSCEEHLLFLSSFLLLTMRVKSRFPARDYHRGLLAMGLSKMEGQAKVDLKESYIWGEDFAADNPEFLARNELLPPNRWPAFLPEMQDFLIAYLAAAHQCGKALLRAIAASMGIEHDYFVGKFHKPITRSTLIHYPPQPDNMGTDQFGGVTAYRLRHHDLAGAG